MSRRMKRRLSVLIGATTMEIVLGLNAFFCMQKVLYMDNIVLLHEDYSVAGNYRGIYSVLFLVFLLAACYLGCLIIEYRGHLYDRFFRKKDKN